MSLDTQAITARMNKAMVNWRPDIWTQLNIIQFTEAMIEGLSLGNAVVFGNSLVRMMRMSLQELATVHASDYTQRCQLLTWQSFSGVQYAVRKRLPSSFCVICYLKADICQDRPGTSIEELLREMAFPAGASAAWAGLGRGLWRGREPLC